MLFPAVYGKTQRGCESQHLTKTAKSLRPGSFRHTEELTKDVATEFASL